MTRREWCCYCGNRLTGPSWSERDWCARCSPYERGCDINAEAEVFWSAITHERSRTERLAAAYTLSAMLSEEIVALASLDATDRTDPARFDEVRAEAMRLVGLIQTEVGK